MWVQPEDTYRRREVQMWGEVGVEQLYEKICNKSRSNFYFSCAFPVQICRSLLTKCMDPYACCACWMLANLVHGYVCINPGAPDVPSPQPWSQAVLKWWHRDSMCETSSPPRGNQGLSAKRADSCPNLPPSLGLGAAGAFLAPQLRKTQGTPMPVWLQWWGECLC